MIVDGRMQYLWDETGRRYLDVRAGVGRAGAGATPGGPPARAPTLTPHHPPPPSPAPPHPQAFAGIVTVSVGHCHPGVTAAIEAQSRRLQHTTTIYLNDQVALYAAELAARLPPGLDASG